MMNTRFQNVCISGRMGWAAHRADAFRQEGAVDGGPSVAVLSGNDSEEFR